MLSRDEDLNHQSLQLGGFFLAGKKKIPEELSLTSLEMLLLGTANQSL